MSLQVKRRPLTVAAWHLLAEAGMFGENDRIELLNGEMIERSPIGSRHAGHVNLLQRILGKALIDPSLMVVVQNPIALGDYSEPQPDISVLRFREDYYAQAHPRPEDVLLLIEVSDSTMEFDREIKLPLYAAALISEVWLLNLQEQQLEIYQAPSGGSYTEVQRHSASDPVPLEGLISGVTVGELFIRS